MRRRWQREPRAARDAEPTRSALLRPCQTFAPEPSTLAASGTCGTVGGPPRRIGGVGEDVIHPGQWHRASETVIRLESRDAFASVRRVAVSRRSCLAAAASVSLAWAGRGDAKPVAGIELHWVAPARCPGAEDVRARVSQLLGSDAGASSGERLVAEGRVVEANGRYRLSLKVRQPNAQPAEVTRVVESTSCDGLAGAAAVILALFARGEADRAASPAAPSGTDTPSSLPPSESAQASSGGSSPPPSREGGPPSGSTPGASPSPQASSSPPPSGARKTANPQPVTRVAPPGEEAHGPPPALDQDRIETGRWRPALQGPLLASDAGVLPSEAYGAGGGIGIRVSHLVVILSGVLWAWQDDTRATSATAAY